MPETAKSKNPRNLSGLEDRLNHYLVSKAPYRIPPNGRETITRFSPWIILVMLIFSLPAIFAISGFGFVVAGLNPVVGVNAGWLYYLASGVLAMQVVAMAIAIPGLFKRQRKAWQLIYYSCLIALVYTILDWLASAAAVFSLVLGLFSTLIILYLLFQVRGYYVNR